MIKKALLVGLLLLVPCTISAAITLGMYFDNVPSQMAFDPAALTLFDAFLYISKTNCGTTFVEYQLFTPDDPTHLYFDIAGIDYPDNVSVTLGDPFTGHAISYWPPIDGSIGYNILCKLSCYTIEPCWSDGGLLADFPIVIGPRQETGLLRISCYPYGDIIPVIGLTSILCSKEVSTGDSSWGTIKNMLGE